MNKNQEMLLGLGACLLFLVILPGGFLVIFGYVAWNDLRANTVYREAGCVIEVTRIDEHESHDSESKLPYMTYYPVIAYRYSVADRNCTSERYDIWESGFRSASKARAVVNRFTVGERYSCWYDPADPMQAVLTRELNPKYFWALIPVACLLAGVIAIARLLRGQLGSIARTSATPDAFPRKPEV